MISSQARSMGGGPPTRNITFSLGQNTAQPPLPVTQPGPPFEDFGGGHNVATNQPQCNHGVPLGGLENTGALGVGVGAALATATGTSPYSGFNYAIQNGVWGPRPPLQGTSNGNMTWTAICRRPPNSRKLLAVSKTSAHTCGDALPDEVCRDQRSNTASPRKVYWLCWGPHPHKGSHLNHTPTTKKRGAGRRKPSQQTPWQWTHITLRIVLAKANCGHPPQARQEGKQQ